MAFDADDIVLIGEVDGVSWYDYVTTDTITTVEGAGYFNDYAKHLDENDKIWVVASDYSRLYYISAVVVLVNIQGVVSPTTGTDSVSITAVAPASTSIIVSATDRVLGRDSAGAGPVEELTVSGGIEFTGTGGLQTSAFTGDVTKTAGGTALTIAADAVTNTQLANMAQSTIKGRASGAGTGDPTDLTSSQVDTILGTSGSWTLIQSQTASSSATIDFTSGINSTYDEYVFVLSNVVPATDNVSLRLQVSTDGGSTWKSTAGDYISALNILKSDSTNTPTGSTVETGITLHPTSSNNSGRPISGEVRVVAPHLSKLNPIIWFLAAYNAEASPLHQLITGSAFYNAGTASNGIRFAMSSGNISTGTFALYGVKK